MKESSPPLPGTSSSFTTSNQESILPSEELDIKTEKDEIDQLKLPKEEPSTEPPLPAEEDDRIPRINFCCSSCGMNEMVHYKGTEPPFVLGVKLMEENYIMRDPFQQHPPRWRKKPEFFICLGAHCCLCDRLVCRDVECSFYYVSTFCVDCAKEALKSFPLEVQTKLRKQLASVQ
ncbi:cysteine-rich DPF motif domain-containing protein 1 [Episyrphus balteatus]|uniref:cysteine-rich DPF motif domain-containing protein 1 n=1 Tax=Episyrphus balteatus TaxID=286459 RepID=UPI002485832D|nr:cysteine-rich DPF motif domain-containing protein 1 [Episyrphus balteatus]